jgi:hypothetical protein
MGFQTLRKEEIKLDGATIEKLTMESYKADLALAPVK